MHGLHYCRLLLLALLSHSGPIFIHSRPSRMAILFSPSFGYRRGVFVGAIYLLASFSPLHWVLWATYTYGLLVAKYLVFQPSISYPLMNALRYPSSLVERSVLGPTITIHLGVLTLWSSLTGLFRAGPLAARAVRRISASVCRRPLLPLHFLCDCIRVALKVTLCSLPLVLWCLWQEYNMQPDIKRYLWQRPQFLQRSRYSLRRVYWIPIWRYRGWKARQAGFAYFCFLTSAQLPGNNTLVCRDVVRDGQVPATNHRRTCHRLLWLLLYHTGRSQASGIIPESTTSLNSSPPVPA
ncbi:hypothetical protein B0H17DRAFT_1045025 [Mycena rosella]|uniref:Uncharacterized protein n=1 Tax=Mycena rosella TaxID=1033263 RepID=A0AAD7GMD9_MYCRO|nr:hypothetical protein B0H17DRAFT_1045025 [Mycena rosella]